MTDFNPATLEFAKHEQARRRRQRVIASITGVTLVAGIAAGGYFGWQAYAKSSGETLAKQMVADFDPSRGRESWEKARAAVDAGELSRDQLRDAMRERFEKEQQARQEAYFKTPVKDRQAYLDKLIDEMEAQRKKAMAEWMRDRPTTAPTTRPNRDRPTSRPAESAERQRERDDRARARNDNQSPMQRAQEAEFRAAMQRRREERGIQGGGWGGGRGGFGGGGRGGPGGGGR